MKDFFSAQKVARFKTKKLILYLLGATFLISILLSLVLIPCFPFLFHERLPSNKDYDSAFALYFYLMHYPLEFLKLLSVGKIIISILLVMLFICFVSLYRYLKLLKGGGGDLIKELNTRNIDKLKQQNLKIQRLKNVVEEMSIAACIPVPSIYLILGQGDSINALEGKSFPGQKIKIQL